MSLTLSPKVNHERGPQSQSSFAGGRRENPGAKNATPFHTPRPPASEGVGAPLAEPQDDDQEEHRGLAAEVWSCSPGNPQLLALLHRCRQDGASSWQELQAVALPPKTASPHPWGPLARHGMRVLLVLPTR